MTFQHQRETLTSQVGQNIDTNRLLFGNLKTTKGQ